MDIDLSRTAKRLVPVQTLGEGAFKRAYTVKGSAHLVMLTVMQNEDCSEVREELKSLRLLHENGVPATKVYATYNGKHGYGYIAKRYRIGNRCRHEDGLQLLEALNARSLRSIQIIRETLWTKRIVCGDLQFLVDYDGALVVSDPGHVEQRTEGQVRYSREAWYDWTRQMGWAESVLTAMERKIHYAIAVQQGAVTPKLSQWETWRSTPALNGPFLFTSDLDDLAAEWCEKRGLVPERNWGNMLYPGRLTRNVAKAA